MNLLHLARDVSHQNQLHLEVILFCFEIPFKFQTQHDEPQTKLELIYKSPQVLTALSRFSFCQSFTLFTGRSVTTSCFHFSESIRYRHIHCQREREALHCRPRWSWGGSAVRCVLPSWKPKGKELHPDVSENLWNAPLDLWQPQAELFIHLISKGIPYQNHSHCQSLSHWRSGLAFSAKIIKITIHHSVLLVNTPMNSQLCSFVCLYW